MNSKEPTLAPIVIFAYHRAELFQNLLCSLQQNELAEHSELFIYIDGATDSNDEIKVSKVRGVANTVSGFKSVDMRISQTHKGLAKSVVSGITEILQNYDRIIVLEDDLVVSRFFLKYMNAMLQKHEQDKSIMQISGFGGAIPNSNKYNGEYYLCGRAQSWGWATWSDRWTTIDWNVSDYETFMQNEKVVLGFSNLGSDLITSLQEYVRGDRDVWLIAYIYNMYRKKGFCICPIHSLVKNEGFGENASNCKNYNRYRVDFNNDTFYDVNISEIPYNATIERKSLRFWSIRYRIYGKVMTILQSFFLCGKK